MKLSWSAPLDGLEYAEPLLALGRVFVATEADSVYAINAASGWIPIGLLPGPPTYRQVNPADVPVLILALTSETMPLHEVNERVGKRLSHLVHRCLETDPARRASAPHHHI